MCASYFWEMANTLIISKLLSQHYLSSKQKIENPPAKWQIKKTRGQNLNPAMS